MSATAAQGTFPYQHPTVAETQRTFNGQDDFDILRMRHAKYTWQMIADNLGSTFDAVRKRHARLIELGMRAEAQKRREQPRPAAPDAIAGDNHMSAESAKLGSAALLRRQLATGQYSGAARQAWLAKHGERA